MPLTAYVIPVPLKAETKPASLANWVAEMATGLLSETVRSIVRLGALLERLLKAVCSASN